MGVANIEIKVQPTSVDSMALKVEGHVVCDHVANVEVDFGGWTISSSRFLKNPESARIIGDNIDFSTEKTSWEAEFELLLSPTKETSDKLQVSKGKDFVWKIVGNFYPFIARKLQLPIGIRSSRNKINLNVNLVLSSNMIPYGGKVGIDSQGNLKDEKLQMFSGNASGQHEVNHLLSVTLRFAPFFAFRKSLSPIVLIFAAALITQVLQKITSLSMKWEFFDITVEPIVALSLLQMTVNVYLFLRVSKIEVGIVGTRSFLVALKVMAWSFMGLLTLNAAYPSSLAVLGFNIFDLILKGSQIWVIATIVISLFIYPYVSDEAKRTHIISIITLIVFISSIWCTIALPTLSTASDLLASALI